MTELGGGQVVGWSAGIAVLIGVLNVLWRAFGRTRVEGTRNTAESEFYTTLSEENRKLRERADEAFKQRNDAMIEIGSLRAQVSSMSARMLEQSLHIERLEAQIATLREQMSTYMQRKP